MRSWVCFSVKIFKRLHSYVTKTEIHHRSLWLSAKTFFSFIILDPIISIWYLEWKIYIYTVGSKYKKIYFPWRIFLTLHVNMLAHVLKISNYDYKKFSFTSYYYTCVLCLIHKIMWDLYIGGNKHVTWKLFQNTHQIHHFVLSVLSLINSYSLHLFSFQPHHSRSWSSLYYLNYWFRIPSPKPRHS